MSDTKPAADEAETEAKRSPGRPKGLPRTGGRPKGSKNRLPEEFRRFIDQRGRPLEFLAAVARGNLLSAADPADPTKKTKVYPTLGERTLAAKTLLDRLLPVLKAQELSGPNGGPVQTADVTDPKSAAERLADVLDRLHVGKSEEPAAPAEPEGPEPPQPEELPVGHHVEEDGHTLTLAERTGDRERWEARDGGGRLVGTAFWRQALSTRLRAARGER